MNSKHRKCFFLRGLVREAGHWSGFLESFASAFPDIEAIPLDLPGNGVHFREKSPLSVKEMADAVRRDFLNRKGEENYLFALSLGGMIGLEWLHHWPADLRGAVLANTSVRGLSPLHQRLRPGNLPRIMRMFFSADPFFIERSILEMTSERTDRFSELTEAWVKIHQEHPVSVANALRQLLAAACFHPPGEKPLVPILILNGAADKLVNPTCSKALAEHWKLTLQAHPGAGHDLTLDAPEWVIDQLKVFFRELCASQK